MKVREYDFYIFDLDGTLFTLPVDWLAVRKELSQVSGEAMEGSPLFLRLEKIAAARPTLKSRMFQIIDSYELRAADGAKEAEGASLLLSSLFEVARLALVTMQGRRVCDQILRKHGLSDLFETVVTREESMDRAEQLGVALNRMAASPGDALFTGDRLNDVICAKKVGVDVALIGGKADVEPKPTYGFPTLEELRAYLA